MEKNKDKVVAVLDELTIEMSGDSDWEAVKKALAEMTEKADEEN